MTQRIVLVLIGIILLSSCEDVVNVELPTDDNRLVVDGLLRVDKSQEFIDVRITLRETSNFYDENQPTQAESALIYYGILNENNIFENLAFSYLIEEEPGTGVYVPNPDFSSDQRIRTASAQPGVTFILEVTHKGKRYFARTMYAPAVPLDNLEQGDDTLFEDDETEVKVTFTDDPEITNYYVFDFGFGEFQTVEDQFFNGQQFQFSYFYDSSLEPGQEINVSLLGATEDFYDYVDLVIEQTTNNSNGVFGTPVATVRGNVVEITGQDYIDVLNNNGQPNDYALGYFAVVQEYTQTLIIQ